MTDLFMLLAVFFLEHGRELAPDFLAAFLIAAFITGTILALIQRLTNDRS